MGAHVVICDPWTTQGIFDGGWTPFPPVHSPEDPLLGVSHCFISHIHEDHCDYNVIRKLPRKTKMFVPDIFSNHLIVGRLRKLGFNDVFQLAPGTPVWVEDDLLFEVIGPMNGFAMERELYNSIGEPLVAIDCGLIVSFRGTKLVLLSDNSPYSLSDARDSLARMKSADLLAFPYNGFGDDYPVCYDNLTLEQKRNASLRRCAKRFVLQTDSIKALSPKCLMPYSSDFAVRGPRAIEFEKVHPMEWLDKEEVARRYSDAIGVPSVALFEQDRLSLRPNSCEVIKGEKSPPSLDDYAQMIYRSTFSPETTTSSSKSWDELRQDIIESSRHMFKFLDRSGAKSDWILSFNIADQRQRISIDMRERDVFEGERPGRKLLECSIGSGYLVDHLEFRRHWNNSVISYNLAWRREPDEFDYPLSTALNFFHKPSMTAASLR